jgi:uncharacterized NAD(P)/FAD-binding protein YdhS
VINVSGNSHSDGALLDFHGAPSSFLFALGPARKVALWKSTAVPKIRNQAAQLAAMLASKLKCSSTSPTEDQSEEIDAPNHIHFKS